MIAAADGCRGGWIVATADKWPSVKPAGLTFCTNFAEVMAATSHCRCVMVDIPIGLADNDAIRRCDTEARRELGTARARVFNAPPRGTLSAKTPTEFQALHRAIRGMGASIPLWGIVPKIREVDSMMTAQLQERVKEYHPELTWKRLAGRVSPSKHCAAGINTRLTVLDMIAPRALPGDWQRRFGPAVRKDDILDAIAGLAAAAACLESDSGPAFRLPAREGERDSKGLFMEMWY